VTEFTVVRDAVVARVNTVTGIGAVHSYQRFTNNWTDFLTIFAQTISGNFQVRGWFLTRDRITSVMSAYDKSTKTHHWKLRGIMGVFDSDNTEEIFQNLVDQVLTAIEVLDDAGQSSVVKYSIGPVSAPIIEGRVFGDVLCHYCEIDFTVDTENTIAFQ
jgi:hypothetical protein